MRKRSRCLGLLVGLFAAATARAQQPNFHTNIGDQILDGGESLVVDDIDKDGKLDLIVPGGQGGNVAILYGLGDGTFEAQQDIFVGNVPVLVAVGDFNGDTRLDLATADSTSSSISVVLATGDREFSGDVIVSTPRICSTAGTTCEFDTDCPEGQTCQEHGVPSPSGLVAARLNDDQILDLAIVSGEAQGGVAVVFGDGNGAFATSLASPYSTGLTSLAVQAADLNHDTKLDLLTANRDGGTVSVLMNNGGGQFAAAVNYPAGESPVDIAVGDFNGDNKPDAVVANRNSNSFSLLIGNGTGVFGAPTSFAAGAFPSSIAAADLDGDTRLDVIVGNNLSYDVTIAYGTGGGRFDRTRSYLAGTGPSVVAAGSINSDQDDRTDIVVLGKSGELDGYKVLLGEAERSFQSIETLRTGDNPNNVAVGDVNGDGLPDAVVTSSQTALTLITPQQDHTLVSTSIDVGSETSAVLLADIDRDGHSELLFTGRAEANDFVGVAKPNGLGGFAPAQTAVVEREPSALDAADLNGDGLLDVVVTEASDDTVAIFLTQPDGTLGTPTRIQLRPIGEQDAFLPQAVTAADLDGDGFIDLAIAIFRDDGMISLLYGKGDGTFTTPVNMASGRRPLGVVVSDIDTPPDGKLDLVTVNQDSSGMIVHHGTAGPVGACTRSVCYDAPRTLNVGNVPASLALRDVTGDGIRDAVVADRSTADRIVIRPGGATAAPFFRSIAQSCPEPGCAETGRTPVSIVGADFNGDGAYDVLTVNNGGGNIAVATSALVSTLIRGDANQDGRVSAADLPKVMGRIPAFNRLAIEDLVRAGDVDTLAYDADGDGLLSSTDTIGTAARIFR